MKKLLLLSALFASFIGCKKIDPVPEKPYYKTPVEVWDYINLYTASWYIYKDSATGLTDSVNVTGSGLTLKNPVYYDNWLGTLFGIQSGVHHYIDVYALYLTKVDLSGNKTHWLGANSRRVFYEAGSVASNYWEFYGTRPEASMIFMQYPPNLSASVTQYKISSAVIEGNTYADILVVKDNSGGRTAEVWWVKKVGIVKLTRTVGNEIKTSLLLRQK